MRGIFKYLLLLWCSIPSMSTAWSPNGHMVIASIAYQHLSPGTQEKINQLVSVLNFEYKDINSFLLMASWADSLRGQKIETFTHWHYVNFPFSLDSTPCPNIVETDNAIWAINTIQVIVKNTHANNYERARFLAFVTHIVGDLHQPLHAVSEISAANPEGDRGGNLTSVFRNNERINLHHLWDGGVGYLEGEFSAVKVNELAKHISTEFPIESFADDALNLNPNQWAKEGMQIAREHVYNMTPNQEISPNYIITSQKVVEQRLALAGYRLANLLEKLLN